MLRNLPCERIQTDELWGFVAVKEAHGFKATKYKSDQNGDCLGLDLHVRRHKTCCWQARRSFLDLSDRLDGRRFQLTTDGFNSGLSAAWSDQSV
jgi:hypothetical protein